MSDFPTKQNPQPCKNGCGTKIYLSNKNEKKIWLPYELDEAYHDCPNYQKLDKFTTGTAEATATKNVKLTTEQIELTVQQLLDRLTQVGITIDIKSILNVKRAKKEK